MTGLEQSDRWINLNNTLTNNKKFFSQNDDTSSLRMQETLTASLNQLKNLPPLYDKIARAAPLFDFDADTPGNGYRSFIVLVDKCLDKFLDVNQQILTRRGSYFFRQTHYMKEIEACSQVVAALFTCLQHLETLYDWNEGKNELSLFTTHTPHELLTKAKTINQYCFYGRCLGFQYCDSIRRILTVLSCLMSSYSEWFYNDGRLISRFGNFMKYFHDPEARAKRITNLSQWAEVEFCQSFWTLSETELVQFLSKIVVPMVAVNHVMQIPPEELVVETVDGIPVDVPIPMSHIGMKYVQVRLLSDVRREGMVGTGSRSEPLAGLSKALIIHCHGGGFVAQSSRSHEIYLRRWTKDLGVPILSIDYSLAPEAPYPRALEEVTYVYAWVLKKGRSILGSTLEKIVLVGDSAGANLLVGTTLKCIEMNIRLPDGISMMYAPTWVEFIPSPSRLLCLTDPLLPFGFLMRCLKSYATVSEKKPSSIKVLSDEGKDPLEEFVFEVPRDPLLSPYLTSDEVLQKLPPCKILTMELDPCLDDAIMFAKKLRRLGVPVTLDIVRGLVHGFLNFVGISQEAEDASNLCVKRMRELMED